MRASIRDTEVLASLRPTELVAYLRSKGWDQQRRVADRFSIWKKTDTRGEFEVELPLAKFRDFSQRMGEVLSTLEIVEQRSQLEIISDLNTATADVIRVRTNYVDTAPGSILIDDAVDLFDRSRKLVLSAACAAVETRPYFSPKKFGQALDYLHKVRMGQTERGSYVVTIISPVAPAFENTLEQNIDQPFERKVTSTLASAIGAVRNAAEEAIATGSFEPFRDAVALGVSANLCEAISGLIGKTGESRGIDFSFTWSRTRPPNQPIPPDISLRADVLPVIQEAGRVLRETSPIEEFELVGMVVRLDRPTNADTGTVTVIGFVEEHTHLIRMELSGEDYDAAVRAHADRALIVCVGVLAKEGRTYVLSAPRNFRLAEIEE